jgi:acetyl esterase
MEQNWFWQRTAMRAGLAVGAAMSGRLVADGQAMDPVMSALVRLVRRRPPDAGDIAKLRTDYAALLSIAGLRPDPKIRMKELTIPGLPPAREYALAGKHRGTLLYFHGGGFIMGSPAVREGLCRRFAAGTGMRVVSVGYLPSPEHPFPAAHDDAAAALAWARREGGGPLLVGGDSAGANLAAALAQDGAVHGQVLIYPVVDMVQSAGRYPSLDVFADGYLLTAAGMEACAQALILPGVDRDQARLSPIRADMSRAAPALIVVAGFDPLRDQGVAYAEALRLAGRPVKLLEEAALVHGFADFAGVVPEARRAVDRMVRASRAMI